MDFLQIQKGILFGEKSQCEDDNTHKLAFFKQKPKVFSVKSAHFKALNKPFIDRAVLFLNDIVKKCRSFSELESES